MKNKLLLLSVTLTLFTLSAFSATDKTLNLYGSGDRGWIAAIAKKYEVEKGVKVNWIRASSNEMYTRISAEKSNPAGDVWFGGTLEPHAKAATDGLTEPYCSPKMSELRPEIKDPLTKCKSIGLYVGPLGFAVNKQALEKLKKPIPASWEDLTKADYKGMIAMANPSTSGTAFTALATIMQLKGEEKAWDYLKKLHQNVAQYTQSGTAPGQLVGSGEVAIGIMFLHDVVALVEQGFPVTPIAPSEGTGYEIGGLSLIKGAPHAELAKDFINWSLTPEVQKIAREHASFQTPSNKATPTPKELEKFGISMDKVKLIKYDFDWTAKNYDRILKAWNTQVFSIKRDSAPGVPTAPAATAKPQA